jgi:hypothetical protein
MDVDIVCVGFGPAAGGFLTTLARQLPLPGGSMPQDTCYERALLAACAKNPFAGRIPAILREAHALYDAAPLKRLSQTD